MVYLSGASFRVVLEKKAVKHMSVCVCVCFCVAMRIQLSEDIYDYLVTCEPQFIMVNRGLRLVLVSITCTTQRRNYEQESCAIAKMTRNAPIKVNKQPHLHLRSRDC